MANEESNNISIGDRLKEARVEKGLSLDEIQQQTKIQKKYLMAIEENDLGSLPGDFYVRAFTKQYAFALGFDSSELVDNYEDSIPNTNTSEYIDKISENTIETRSEKNKITERNTKIRGFFSISIIVGIVLIILLVIWFASAKMSSTNSSSSNNQSISVSGESNQNKESSTKDTQNKTENQPNKSNKATTTIKQANQSGSDVEFNVSTSRKNSIIKLSSNSRAWTSLTSDGDSSWSGILDSNSPHSIKLNSTDKNISFSLGNAAATSISINGQKVKLPSPEDGGNAYTRTIKFSFK